MMERHTGARIARTLLGAACLAILGLAPAAARADDPAPPRLAVSGFGTLGAVTTDSKDVWYTRWGVNFPGDSDPDFSPDTVIGLQASMGLGAHGDVTLQAIASEDGRERQDPRVTLAFYRHILAPELSLRVGRLRAPFFMLSDSLYVNYANPWVRPPVEVYGLNPFNDFDGIDLTYHAHLGPFQAEFQPYFGTARVAFPNGHAKLDQTLGLNVAFTRGFFSLHLGHGEADLTLERGDPQFLGIARLLNAVRQGAVVRDLSGEEGRTTFDSIGVQWDDGTWQFVGEYAKRWANRYVVTAHGWYLSLGRRFGAVTPYVSFARQNLDRQFAEARLPPGLRVPIGGGQTMLATDLWDVFLGSRNNAQRSITLGARWDVLPQAALKFELNHARPDDNSWGSYFPRNNPLTTRVGGRTLNTFSVSVDMSF